MGQYAIIVTREQAAVAIAVKYKVSLDGQPCGHLTNGQTITIYATEPGLHTVAVSSWGMSDAYCQVDVQPDGPAPTVWVTTSVAGIQATAVAQSGSSTSQAQPVRTMNAAKKMTPCKTCGQLIAKNAKICPHCGAKNKLRHPILGAVLLVFGITLIFAAVSGTGNSRNTPTKVGDNSASPSAAVSTAPEKTTFGVGEKVELRDTVVTLLSVTTDNGSQYNRPSEGNEFVICEFEIENNSSKDIAISSLMSFEAYFDDYATNYSLSAMLSASDKQQLDGTIAAGKKMNGVVGYEAAKDWKSIEVRINPDFWARKKIIFTAGHP